jgi:hypothetical protein
MVRVNIHKLCVQSGESGEWISIGEFTLDELAKEFRVPMPDPPSHLYAILNQNGMLVRLVKSESPT